MTVFRVNHWSSIPWIPQAGKVRKHWVIQETNLEGHMQFFEHWLADQIYKIICGSQPLRHPHIQITVRFHTHGMELICETNRISHKQWCVILITRPWKTPSVMSCYFRPFALGRPVAMSWEASSHAGERSTWCRTEMSYNSLASKLSRKEVLQPQSSLQLPAPTLAAALLETPSQTCPIKLDPDFWPTATPWDNKCLLFFNYLHFRVACYVSSGN